MSDPSINTVSQFAHVGVAYAVTLSVLMVVGIQAIYWFIPMGVGAAAVKEFWYDAKYETAEVRGSSLQDFLFYCAGIAGAALFWMFAGGN